MSKIMIIEDDVLARNELRELLEKNGYDVQILQNFNNPIEEIVNADSNLLLLDINIPYIDGELLLLNLSCVKHYD